MGYVENNLQKNEKIIFKGKLSMAKVLVGIIWFPILGFFVNLIKRASNHLTLTNQRIVGKVGLIKSASIDCKLEKVQSVSVSSGLGGKLFGYGNITVKTAADSITFTSISGAEKMKQRIMAQIDIAQEEKGKAQAKEMAMAMAAAMKQ